MLISTAIQIIRDVASACYAIIYGSILLYDGTLYASLLLIVALFMMRKAARRMNDQNNSGHLWNDYRKYGPEPYRTTQIVPVPPRPPARPSGPLRWLRGRSIADKITLVPMSHERETDRISVRDDPPWRPTKEAMPRDLAGRRYLSVTILHADTHALVHICVANYHQVCGRYPDQILLSRHRWIIFGEEQQAYSPFPGMYIPYGCESGGGYDIMVRGDKR